MIRTKKTESPFEFDRAGSRVDLPPDQMYESFTNAYRRQVAQNWNRMLAGMVAPWMDALKSGVKVADRMMSNATYSDSCAECGADPCQCRCCVVNADLLVRARVGERRVVPIVIENNVRRQREIELQISDWSDGGLQNIEIKAALSPPVKFTLEPCSEFSTTLVIEVVGKNSDANSDSRDDRQIPDVEDCRVFYADLRIKGCDNRSIRIAVIVLPRDCEPYRIDCNQCCC